MSNTLQKTKDKPYAQLGFSQVDANKLVGELNLLLANYSVHYQKLRNYHWNVKGADFFDIHEKFEEHYNEAKENIDEVAEKIRVFGLTPLSTMKDYLEKSEIKETGTDLNAEDMVIEILSDFQILVRYFYKVIDEAVEIGDLATEDIIKDMIKNVETHHWMWSSFLSK